MSVAFVVLKLEGGSNRPPQGVTGSRNSQGGIGFNLIRKRVRVGEGEIWRCFTDIFDVMLFSFWIESGQVKVKFEGALWYFWCNVILIWTRVTLSKGEIWWWSLDVYGVKLFSFGPAPGKVKLTF